MLRRLIDQYLSLTRRQQVAMIVLVAILILVLVALLVGEAVGAPRLGASVSLGLILLATVAALLYIRFSLRFLRRPVTQAGLRAAAEVGSRPSLALFAESGPPLVDTPVAAEMRWLAELTTVPSRSILAHGLATRSHIARDYFALLATYGRFDSRSMAGLLLECGDDTRQAVTAVGPAEPNALVSLARLLLAHPASEHDLAVARLLGRLVPHQMARLTPLSCQVFVQQSILAGEQDLALPVLDGMRAGDYPSRFFHLDLLNPHRPGGGRASESAWINAVGGIFRRAGLEPIELLESGPTVFDRLNAQAAPVKTDGPLVTVIMSCYRPDEALITATRSIVAQTYQHWELIITDDASPIDPSPTLERAAALDPRIRIIRNLRNEGTYVRRNEAVAQARGELVTMHDSDDWAHPRRLEVQVRHLLDNPGLIANVSQSMRVSEGLMFTQPRGASIRLTESSLLFWRQRTFDLISGFDVVRKAADSEFRMRLETAVGSQIPLLDLEAPLSLVRFDAQSLSGGDLRDGWLHPARIAYRGAQLEWRRQQGRLGRPLSLGQNEVERPFPAHGHLTGAGPATHDLDILYVLDPRGGIAHGGPIEDAAAELARLAAAGLRVGLRRAEAIVPERPPVETHTALQGLINDSVLREVLPVDTASARTIVVRQPAALAGISPLDVPVSAQSVLVVAGGVPIPSAIVERSLRLLAPERGSTRSVDASAWPKEFEGLVTAVRP